MALSDSQRQAVIGILSSGAKVETLVGPAGSGKSTVVGALTRIWSDPASWPERRARRVVGLAASQFATEILKDEGLAASTWPGGWTPNAASIRVRLESKPSSGDWRASGLSRAAIHRLTREPIRTVPDPETLRGLAAALDVSIDRVVVAAFRSAGVPVTDRFAAGDVLEGLDQLTPHQRTAIQRIVEVMINPVSPP